MSPFNIYRKTMVFSWVKLGIGMMTLLVCLAIGGAAWLVIFGMDLGLSTSIAIGCTAFLLAVAVYYVIMGRLGYSIKMGHLAIIERALRGESIPSNPIEFSKDIVAKRFGSNRMFYSYSRNTVLAIRELVRVISRGFSLKTDKPNVNSGRRIKLFFSVPALRCTDECCLAYALRRSDYEVNASVVDALTFLVQEWTRFSKIALKIGIFHLIICIATFAVFFVPGYFFFKSLEIDCILWLGVSFFLMLTVKAAFFDSFVLIKAVCEFLQITDSTQIENKNYAKLDSWSKRYAKLREAAENAAEKKETIADRSARNETVNADDADKQADDSLSESALEEVPVDDVESSKES